MAFIPLFRTIIFVAITLLSLAVLGICAHIEWLLNGYSPVDTSFAPLGIAVSCLSIISLPLFFGLETMRNRVFTSMILFEIIWFFVLWLLWVGTAGDAVAGATYYFPLGCSSYVSLANQYCIEFTVVEALAFVNFFCAFIYYDVIFLYAIINAVRGRSIWTSSVKEAVTGTPGAVNSGYPMGQPQYNAPPMQYGAYPPNVPPNQPYNAYPQQAQPYSAYPQQVPPQGPPSQQYNAYHPQSPPQAGQYSPAPGSPQQQASYPGYSTSPTGNDAALPPQPNYNAYPVHGSQAPLPLPSGYQA